MSIVVSDAVELIVRATVGNEQELNRETMSSNTDDRTLHEVYDQSKFGNYMLIFE